MDDYEITPRLRPDGSIDTAYYLRRSRKLRSDQAFTLFAPSRRPRRQGRAWWILTPFRA